MRLIFRLIVLVILIATALVATFYGWSVQPLSMQGDAVEFHIPPGSSLRAGVRQIRQAGVEIDPMAFSLLARLHGASSGIRAGTYAVQAGETPRGLLDMLVAGRVVQSSVTLIEGWTFNQFRTRLDASPDLTHETRGLSEAAIARRLDLPFASLEGRLLPDTYLFEKNASDLEVIRRAVRAMQSQLDRRWTERPPGLPYRNADEALTMASIIEKETGTAADRALVAAVFINRLRMGMRLQTDPTVIYGLRDRFDGNLRKKDLLLDTPYNTYTRNGLPPTPIAMPGLASLDAAFSPAESKALYFVARGDGSSHFSHTLDEHNRAVDRFQRGKTK